MVQPHYHPCSGDCPNGLAAGAVSEKTEQRIAWLESEVAFWKDQQKFASSMLATIADLDEQAPALRQMLRREIERRKKAEDRVDQLGWQLQELTEEKP